MHADLGSCCFMKRQDWHDYLSLQFTTDDTSVYKMAYPDIYPPTLSYSVLTARRGITWNTLVGTQ